MKVKEQLVVRKDIDVRYYKLFMFISVDMEILTP
jgi:hypothetical protein